MKRQKTCAEKTVSELRAEQKQRIMQLLDQNQRQLVRFGDIMEEALEDRDYPQFDQLQSLGDFTDGFMVQGQQSFGPLALQAFMKGFGLDISQPHTTFTKGQYFMWLQSGHQDIKHTLDCLSDAVRELRQQASEVKDECPGPFLAQFDATRDLRGAFY